MSTAIKGGETTAYLKRVKFRLIQDGTTPTPGAPYTGLAATVSVRATVGSASPGAGAGTVTRQDSTNEPGLYYYTPADSEIATAVKNLTLTFSAAGALPVSVEVEILAEDFRTAASTTADVAGAVRTELNAELNSITTTATNVSSLLARLGAWTGVGVDTVLGGFRALMRKNVTVPAAIGGTMDPATASLEALSETLAGVPDSGDLENALAPLATGAQVAALNNVSTTQVQSAAAAALTGQGYTTTRAAKLDNLDAAISSVNAEAVVDINFAQEVLPGVPFLDIVLGRVKIILDENAGTWVAQDITGAVELASGTYARDAQGALIELSAEA